MKIKTLLLLISFPFLLFSQTNEIQGVVMSNDAPIFAANVYCKNNIQNGSVTSMDGSFSLILDETDMQDTLICSYIGFEQWSIPINKINLSNPIIIELKEAGFSFEDIIVKYEDPISSTFSVKKMDILEDVYLNPFAQGDPLKAVASTVYSTTTDETANISLRGSSSDRNILVLNGVPIFNPVRALDLNNQGFFSIFNPEMIDKQFVYPSTPPLIYGNTSGGLVEIQTTKKLKKNTLKLSAGLVGTGFFLSQKIKNNSFIQAFGNFQSSAVFIGIQEDQFPDIDNFSNRDIGLNFNTKIGKKTFLNSYNYYIDENFEGFNESYTYRGALNTDRQRFLTVNTLDHFFDLGVLSFKSSFSTDQSLATFGNIKNNPSFRNFFASANFKYTLLSNTEIQTGISYDYRTVDFNNASPSLFYALRPSDSITVLQNTADIHVVEPYLYMNWKINDKLHMSSGFRSSIPTSTTDFTFNNQIGLKYESGRNAIALNYGRFSHYASPSSTFNTFNLLKSQQTSIDYQYKKGNLKVNTAAYYKTEEGQSRDYPFVPISQINILGLEASINHQFHKNWKYTISYAFIDQKIINDEESYDGLNDFNFLTNASIQFIKPALFNVSLIINPRPGEPFNNIVGATFNESIDLYQPTFENTFFGGRYDNYFRTDLSLSKYFTFKNQQSLVLYFNINNLFNNQNQREIQFTRDYSSFFFQNYQLRTFYFGLVYTLY